MPDLDYDCYVGVNFCHIFDAVHDPAANQLYLRVAQRIVPLEVAAIEVSQTRKERSYSSC